MEKEICLIKIDIKSYSISISFVALSSDIFIHSIFLVFGKDQIIFLRIRFHVHFSVDAFLKK